MKAFKLISTVTLTASLVNASVLLKNKDNNNNNIIEVDGNQVPLMASEAAYDGEPQMPFDADLSSLLADISAIYGDVDADATNNGQARQQLVEILPEILATDPSFLRDLEQHLHEKKTSRQEQVNFFANGNQKFKSKTEWDYQVTNEQVPEYQLRANKPDPQKLKIDSVKQYSGYLDVLSEDKHFFYWFFESRNDPKNDPIILWLNGGPGCSSFLGLFFELGPSLITVTGDLKYNRNSWNNNASVIFLDQPVNVGFSYSGNQVTNSYAAAKDVFAFLKLFFQSFPEYSHLDFHVAGESYAGVYIPLIAEEILSHQYAPESIDAPAASNNNLVTRNFNLSSILIGNGITDPVVQYQQYQPMLCGKGWPGHQIVPDDRCDKMLTEAKNCDRLVQACYRTNFSVVTCLPALLYCDSRAFKAVNDYGINTYDIRMKCGDTDDDECYPEQTFISEYLNQPEVQQLLGAEVTKYEACSNEVGNRFVLTADQIKPYQKSIARLLDDHKLPILIYAGDKDYICNWLGNEAWTNELEYTGHFSFELADYYDFYLLSSNATDSGNDAAIGKFKSFENFTFFRIYDAGHMVPHDQGAASSEMVRRWISGDYAFGH